MNIGIACYSTLSMQRIGMLMRRATGLRVAWMASSAEELKEALEQDRPSVTLVCTSFLDRVGIDSTEQVLHCFDQPMQVVFCRGDPGSPGDLGLEDVLAVSEEDEWLDHDARELLQRIAFLNEQWEKIGVNLTAQSDGQSPEGVEYIVAIGASAGGPQALVEVLSHVPGNSPACFVVAQHLEKNFIPRFAGWLSQHIELQVKITNEGELMRPGCLFLSNGEGHLILRKRGFLGYKKCRPEEPYCPSVDELFNSVVDHAQLPAYGLLLSGMGDDGARGLLKMKEAGFYTLVQSEKTASVNGMPRAAIQMHAANESVAPGDMITLIQRRVTLNGKRHAKG